jgi:signal transduction histidine kinase
MLQRSHHEEIHTVRSKIARDIHDHLGGYLAQVSLQQGASGRGKDADPIRDLNELIWSVDPKEDTVSSLADYIAHHADRAAFVGDWGLELDIPHDFQRLELSRHLRTELAAVFKEALTNILKHAKADLVSIRLRAEPPGLVLKISDNGRGMPPASSPESEMPATGGRGVSNMKSRIRELNGTLQLEQRSGGGCEIRIAVPLSRD